MTIDVEVSAAGDLFAPNDLFQLPATAQEGFGLAGIRFEGRARPGDSRDTVRRQCLIAAIQQLVSRWPQLTISLFACQSSLQPQNRITLHRRLWGSLEAASIKLPSGDRVTEMSVEADEGTRFFGLIRVPLNEVDRADTVLGLEPESFLAGSINAPEPILDDELVQVWQRHQRAEPRSWAELAAVLCRRGHLVFRPFGFFDDVNVGTDVLLEPQLLRSWGTPSPQ